MTGAWGYRYDLENQTAIWQRSADTYRNWRNDVDDLGVWTEPDEVDPREWFDIHDQGDQGSCQGQSLADCADWCHYLDTGVEVNTSRAFAYLASQAYDGLLGRDQGSTLDGGSKAVSRGLPLESRFPYSENYSQILSAYRSQEQQILDGGDLFKLNGEVPLPTEPDCKRWLSTHSGIIHIGIMWGLPDAWEITSYQSGGGGHAVTLCGYLKVDKWSPFGYGYLLKNSWSERWGKGGWALVHPKAITQMLSARWSVFVGRSEPATPRPKPYIDL